MIRTVSVGPLTIRLWIDANEGVCEHCDEIADDIAMLVATLANGDDEPLILAEKIANTMNAINRVEVNDERGNGGAVYPRLRR